MVSQMNTGLNLNQSETANESIERSLNKSDQKTFSPRTTDRKRTKAVGMFIQEDSEEFN